LKIVVDMNLSPAWVTVFQAAGWEAEHWRDVGPADAPDTEVFRYVSERKAVLFTHDLDFPAILAANRGRGPSVVQLRGNSLLPHRSGPRVIAILRSLCAELEAGAIVTIDVTRHRVRLLPLR